MKCWNTPSTLLTSSWGSVILVLQCSRMCGLRCASPSYKGCRDFSVSDCTITHERIIQFSFITAYEDMLPDEKVRLTGKRFVSFFGNCSSPSGLSAYRFFLQTLQHSLDDSR
ncbi:hypothetical protein EYF80_056079 [Liparis tanakae]|uniref:Secreted protein n=1 Tax=Liparis tanakae TaxID=230148 RepID=A0A4Z2EYU7_9TELE|nr:hypothetical protein EYF80_056079 [Liparis tanakae]